MLIFAQAGEVAAGGFLGLVLILGFIVFSCWQLERDIGKRYYEKGKRDWSAKGFGAGRRSKGWW